MMSCNNRTDMSYLDDAIAANVRQLERCAGVYEKLGKQPQADEIRKLVHRIKEQIQSSSLRQS